MFLMSHVHTRDHGPGCSVADTEPTMRRYWGKVLLYALERGYSNRGASTPSGTPRGPHIEPKEFSCITYLMPL